MYIPLCYSSLLVTSLYCDDSDDIQRYIIYTFPCISYPHSDYEELRNWKISDLNTSDSEVSFNSNNGYITTESLNLSRSLKTGWESRIISTNIGWGSNIHSNINSGW